MNCLETVEKHVSLHPLVATRHFKVCGVCVCVLTFFLLLNVYVHKPVENLSNLYFEAIRYV